MLESIMTSAQPVTRTRQFHTEVSAVSHLTPRMRRITLAGPDLTGQIWPLGCDIALVMAGQDGRELRRRYTVRSAGAGEIVLDALLHGPGVGSAWAASARLGDRVSFYGPRGELPAPSATNILAITDESGLPAIAALIEASDSTVRVIAEVAAPEERYPLPENAAVTWLIRGDEPAGDPDRLIEALKPLAASGAYAYAIAESRAVMQIRDALVQAGVDRADLYVKGYWNLKSRPAH